MPAVYHSVFVGSVACLAVLITSPGVAQTAHSLSGTNLVPQDIARSLSDQQKVVTAPRLGAKIKHRFEKSSPLLPFESGQSPAVLLRLHDYQEPYELVITSLCHCLAFSKSIFVPSGLFLNHAFQQTHELPEIAFDSQPAGMKSYRVTATVSIDEARKDDRFIMLYTLGTRVGERQGTVDPANYPGALVQLNRPIGVKRSFTGTLELESRLKQ